MNESWGVQTEIQQPNDWIADLKEQLEVVKYISFRNDSCGCRVASIRVEPDEAVRCFLSENIPIPKIWITVC